MLISGCPEGRSVTFPGDEAMAFAYYLPTEPVLSIRRGISDQTNDSAWNLAKENHPNMQFASQDELKEHLLATNETFARLASEHANYKTRVADLEAKAQLTLAEEEEEHRLKKLKLKLKDEMTTIMSRYQLEQQHA
jgi:uncharacterized protein YdcH (DUF465 family)